MTTKIQKDVYINLILCLQKVYKLNESRGSTLMLFDENMLAQQLATVLNTIENKSPNSVSSDGVGDFGVSVTNKYTVDSANKNQLVLAALNKLDKNDLINFTYNMIQQSSIQKNAKVEKAKFMRSSSFI